MARFQAFLGAFLFQLLLICQGGPLAEQAFQHGPNILAATPFGVRGGGGVSGTTMRAFSIDRDESYRQLANAIQDRIVVDDGEDLPDIPKLVKALKSLSATQKTFKGLDGAAHEAYQRTHHNENILDVKGRAQRSAARLAAIANSLEACELLEVVIDPTVSNNHHGAKGTLSNRQVLLNVTAVGALGKGRDVRLLILYEPDYVGPAGERHGTIDNSSEASRHHVRGRLLVVITDTITIGESLRLLEEKPRVVRLGKGPEVASVHPTLHDAASTILRSHLESIVRSYPKVSIHVCGYSLSGGVAAITAAILHGELPLQPDKKRKRQFKKSPGQTKQYSSNNTTSDEVGVKQALLQGMFRRKVSALSLGGPPCFSANVGSSFITSIMYGDDIICRTSPDSIERFLDRTRRALKNSGFIGKRLNWISDTMSLASTNLRSHAIGSDGEEARLTVPGVAYLVRPRRLGGLCSIHEIGQQLTNRRDALRASMLWQLNDILLSRSCWRHHELESYIKGLDRVQLRGVTDDD